GRAAELLERARPPGVPGIPVPGAKVPASARFLVLATGPDGADSGSAMDVGAAIHDLPTGWTVEPVWVGSAPADAVARRWSARGARRIWFAETPDRPVPAEAAVDALQFAAHAGPEPTGIALVSDLFGRSVAGRLSAREGWGLTGDAVGIVPGPDARPLYRKPAFGGRWIAEIGTRSGPALVTVRPGALPRAPTDLGGPLPVEHVPLPARPRRVTPSSATIERDGSWGDPMTAPILFVVGQGVAGPESVRVVRDVARSIGAAVGATRRVVDLGWAPRQLQIGLTGLSVDPRIAVLLGVGGSANHLIGLQRAGLLLAVNRDPAALVFAGTDIGIVGDWQEVLPVLARELSATLPGPRATR
ncbi:MAG: electron transfer flavoprotein subunit alpha/FixB family protein, partial [Thermoplasmata archaeon]|nr:electron transfer flavoprotein subunit alpha/FixB family protein [Thermoplasmata archaeon]